MRVDANFYGTVPMPDAGHAGPRPVDRRYGSDDHLAAYRNLTHWARTMDRLGYDTMWLTEHHFQYEGYEVTPNLTYSGSTSPRRRSACDSARCSTSCPSGTRSDSPRTRR